MISKSFMASATVAPISLFAQRHRRAEAQHQHPRKRASAAASSIVQPVSSTSVAAKRRTWSEPSDPVADPASRSESDDRLAGALEEDDDGAAGEDTGADEDDRDPNKEEERVQTQSQPPTKRRRRNNVTATIEIRALREQVQQLSSTLEQLTCKWHAAIPDGVQRVAAFEAARQKWQTALVEAHHKALDEQLMAQMLHMSTLQSLLPQSPVYAMPTSLAMFGALHSPLHLKDTPDEERIGQLETRDELALRLAPSLVDKFTAIHLADVSEAVPFTRTSITADANFTYMSTVFIARIPRVSVQRAHDAVLSYCDRVYSELEQRYKLVHELQPIHEPNIHRRYLRLQSTSPTSFTSVSCSAFSEKTDGESNGVVVMDFVDKDDRFPDTSNPSAPRRDVTQMIHVSTATHPVSKQPQVLLRRVRIDRFNLTPESILLRDEVRLAQAWGNGDLFMALVCQHLLANPVPAPAE